MSRDLRRHRLWHPGQKVTAKNTPTGGSRREVLVMLAATISAVGHRWIKAPSKQLVRVAGEARECLYLRPRQSLRRRSSLRVVMFGRFPISHVDVFLCTISRGTFLLNKASDSKIAWTICSWYRTLSTGLFPAFWGVG